MKPAAFIATVLLLLVAVAHVLRLVFQVEVTAGGWVVPMWLSGIGCIIAAGIAVLLWRENRK